jgi:NADH-quinone oxidoreductase subunit M
MITGVTGIFLSTDLLLFFLFWELMLLPIYLLMVMFNNESSSKSSFKLLVYTQASGLILLVSILCVYFIRGKATGFYTFDYFDSAGILYGQTASIILMCGFLAAFLVKLPAFPVHGWFTSAFKDAPFIAITAGLLIKTGAYGILRFAIPLFPEGATAYAIVFMIIGVITIIYGAVMAYSQTDLRSLAAYIGVSHMGFIVIGLFAYNSIAWQGVILQMLVSAISVSALLFLANSLIKRTGTCNIDQLGGLLPKTPALSGMTMFFAFAILGLPGTGNFIAEFLILAGTFKANYLIAILASVGLVLSVAYSLRIIQKIVVGKKEYNAQISDLTLVEKLVFGILIVLVLWIGIYPKPILSRSNPAVDQIIKTYKPAASESAKDFLLQDLNK